MNDQVKKCIGLLMAAYPRQDFPLPSQKLYIKMLDDIPGEMLEAAVLDLITKNTFLPSISEIRAAVANLHEKASGRLDAFSAWEEVTTQIRRIGSYGQPDFDAITDKAVRACGGWRSLCMSENQIADRARFVQAYDTFCSRERDDGVTLPGVKRLIAGMSRGLLGSGEED